MNIFDVNWLAVVLAAVCGFLVGGIWYGPVMGKRWMGAVGLTEEQVKAGSMPLIYGGLSASRCWQAGRWRIPSAPTRRTCRSWSR